MSSYYLLHIVSKIEQRADGTHNKITRIWKPVFLYEMRIVFLWILNGLAPFLPFCCEEFWKVWPLFITILLWRIFKRSAPFLLFLMSMYVHLFTKQVIGNDLEFQITITKNVSHDHSRSWLPKAPSKWATITHIHDLIGNDCRSHSLIGISGYDL